MTQHFRQAIPSEIPQIWAILQQAIARRKQDGSDQWQDGYPNPDIIQNDIDKNAGFVLTEGDIIIGYSAVLINDEPAYENIKGNWLTKDDFIVVHRIAISESHLGKGLAKKLLGFIEDFAISNDIYSVKADTNFDNFAMMTIFEKLGYNYCGEVHFRGSARKAYEKVIVKKELR
jgi:GNAT superfamily N-acetyltransferase